MTEAVLPLERPRNDATVRPTWRLPLLLFLVGAALSLLASWRPSLWTDEAATISAAQRSYGELWAMAHNIDAVHAAYYAFMHVWLAVFPTSPLVLRLPSALAVGLATVGVYWIGRHLGSGPASLVGALAFAALPRTTWMGMEGRSYAFSALLAVAATLLLLHFLASVAPRRRWLLGVGYGVVAALGVAVNIYLALLLVSHGISVLLSRTVTWRRRWGWLLASVAAVLLASPILWMTLHQTGQLGGGAFGVGEWARDVVVGQWFLGETPTASRGGGGVVLSGLPALWKPAAVALALVGWATILLGVVRRSRVLPLLRWTVPWVVVPTVVIGLYSLAVTNIYNGRYFSYAAPAVGLLLGHGLVALQRRWLRTAAVVLLLVLAAPVYASQRTVYAKSSSDWSGVAHFIGTNHRPSAGVYFSPRYPIVGDVVRQTARGVRVAYPQSFRGMSDVTLLRTPVQDANLSGSSRLLQDSRTQLQALREVWVVRRHDYAYTAQDDQTLAAAGFVVGRRWSGPVDEVVEYTRR